MWGFAKTYIAATILARSNKTLAARERNGATRGVCSETARKERYWNGRATIAAVPTVTIAVIIAGSSKKKSALLRRPQIGPRGIESNSIFD